MDNITHYPLDSYVYLSNGTECNYSFDDDTEEVRKPPQRSTACQMHINFQFAFAGCIAGILCILGIFGNSVAFLIFTRGRQKNVVLLLLRALALADSLYLALYFTVQCWYQLFVYLGNY